MGDRRYLLLMREITEQQRALSRRLHRQRLEATGRLISHIAHDLRAPLSSIIYCVDILAKLQQSEEVRTIQLAAHALRDTIAGLLDFVRLGPPVATTHSLGHMFERISGLLRPAFRRGHHELSLALHDDAVCVRGNTIALEQIFMNLIINATEARPARVHVRVVSEINNRVVTVRVKDDGPGIPPDRRQTVFDEFVTTKPNGTGLGLPTSRRFVEAHGGSIDVATSELGGALFRVRLPLEPESDRPAPLPNEARAT